MKTIKEYYDFAIAESQSLDVRLSSFQKKFEKTMAEAAGGITGMLRKAYGIRRWDLKLYNKYFLGQLMNGTILKKMHSRILVKKQTPNMITWEYGKCPIDKLAIKNPVWWCLFCEIYHREFLKKMFDKKAQARWQKMIHLKGDSCCRVEISLKA